MGNPRSVLVAIGVAAATAVLLAQGCGDKFELPTESPGGFIPPDDSYTFKGSLQGVPEVTSVLITKSTGVQIMVARGALLDTRTDCSEGQLPSGAAELFLIFPRDNEPPISITFDDLWRPQLLAENGGMFFIYDAGDTCACQCSPDSLPRILVYQAPDPAPRAVVFDSAWVQVRGLAVATDRTVYVSGTFRVRERDEFNRFTRRFRDGIWRYTEALTPAGRDTFVRDEDWEVPEGSGTGFIKNQQGIAWGPPDNPFLWVADGEKQSVQKLVIEADSESHGIYQFDGTTSRDGRFLEPTDVQVDDEGFLYVVDRATARVERFLDEGGSATWVQKVNLGILSGEPALVAPIAVAVSDTIVYVSDPPSNAAHRYERRSK